MPLSKEYYAIHWKYSTEKLSSDIYIDDKHDVKPFKDIPRLFLTMVYEISCLKLL